MKTIYELEIKLPKNFVISSFKKEQVGISYGARMANSFEALHVDPKMFKDTTPFTDEGQKLTLSWLNLSYKVKFGGGYKYLVQDLSGIVRPGETLAIMGPSGAGKTSLMNLLANRIKSGVTEGEILVNGKARSKVGLNWQNSSLDEYLTFDGIVFYTYIPKKTEKLCFFSF